MKAVSAIYVFRNGVNMSAIRCMLLLYTRNGSVPGSAICSVPEAGLA